MKFNLLWSFVFTKVLAEVGTHDVSGSFFVEPGPLFGLITVETPVNTQLHLLSFLHKNCFVIHLTLIINIFKELSKKKKKTFHFGESSSVKYHPTLAKKKFPLQRIVLLRQKKGSRYLEMRLSASHPRGICLGFFPPF